MYTRRLTRDIVFTHCIHHSSTVLARCIATGRSRVCSADRRCVKGGYNGVGAIDTPRFEPGTTRKWRPQACALALCLEHPRCIRWQALRRNGHGGAMTGHSSRLVKACGCSCAPHRTARITCRSCGHEQRDPVKHRCCMLDLLAQGWALHRDGERREQGG